MDGSSCGGYSRVSIGHTLNLYLAAVSMEHPLRFRSWMHLATSLSSERYQVIASGSQRARALHVSIGAGKAASEATAPKNLPIYPSSPWSKRKIERNWCPEFPRVVLPLDDLFVQYSGCTSRN